MPRFLVTYRSGKTLVIEAPNPASAREQAMYRGDVLDPKGPKVESVTRTDKPASPRP